MRRAPHRHSGLQSDQTPSSAGRRSLHTREIVGSIPTAPTRYINNLAQYAFNRAHVSPIKSLITEPLVCFYEAHAISSASSGNCQWLNFTNQT